MSMVSNPRDAGDDWTGLEQAILAAGKYVRPTDDLRPRTLEAAKGHCGYRRLVRRVILLGLAALVLLMLSFPAMDVIRERRARATSPSSQEIQRQAIEVATRAGVTSDWGLSQQFDELRRFQANRLGRSGAQ